MSDKLKKFFEKELKPQVDPHKILFQKAEQAEKEGNLEDAKLFLESALLVNPHNSLAQEKLSDFKAQDNLKEVEAKPFIPPFTLVKDHEPIKSIPVALEPFSFEQELIPHSVYTLLDRDGRIASRIDPSIFETKGPVLPGTFHAPAKAKIEEIPIALPDGSETSLMEFKVEAKQGRFILSFSVKQ
jgi:hypothetical protein